MCAFFLFRKENFDGKPSLSRIVIYSSGKRDHEMFSVFLILLFVGMCLSKMNICVPFYNLLTTFLPNSK